MASVHFIRISSPTTTTATTVTLFHYLQFSVVIIMMLIIYIKCLIQNIHHYVYSLLFYPIVLLQVFFSGIKVEGKLDSYVHITFVTKVYNIIYL